jgi:hypothetical protein
MLSQLLQHQSWAHKMPLGRNVGVLEKFRIALASRHYGNYHSVVDADLDTDVVQALNILFAKRRGCQDTTTKPSCLRLV